MVEMLATATPGSATPGAPTPATVTPATVTLAMGRIPDTQRTQVMERTLAIPGTEQTQVMAPILVLMPGTETRATETLATIRDQTLDSDREPAIPASAPDPIPVWAPTTDMAPTRDYTETTMGTAPTPTTTREVCTEPTTTKSSTELPDTETRDTTAFPSVKIESN